MCRFCVGNLFTNPSLFSGWSDPARTRHFTGRRAAPSWRWPGPRPARPASACRRARLRPGDRRPADLIFQGGTIIPLARRGTPRSRRWRFAAARSSPSASQSDIDGLKGDGTKVIDLGGRTLLPGFIDPHQHSCFMAVFAELLTDVGYTTYPTRAS